MTLLRCHGSNIVAAFLIGLPALYATNMWFGYREAWLHPELLGTSAYIWNFPETEHLRDRLRKVFDWKAFDPNVNRVRPLNDFAEIIDAISRPYVARYFRPHPSLTPFALLTAIVSPLLLFCYFRRVGLSIICAAALIAVFISSVGFLSVLVSYVRPAKKLTILFFSLSLYLGQRHANNPRRGVFWAFIVSLYASFFADEMDLGSYVVFGLLFFPSLLWKASGWKRLAFFSLPALFLVAVKWVLPAMYVKFSVHGVWNALADRKKFEVFGYLLDPNLYRVGLIHSARAFLTTVGVQTHNATTELIALCAVFGGAALLIYLLRRSANGREASYRVIATAASLLAVGLYVTLLDWYPFPGEVSYLGSFTFYYHSSLGILVLLWLGGAWQTLLQSCLDRAHVHRAVVLGGTLLCAAAVIANFSMFRSVNRLAQVIHTYPYSSESIHSTINSKLRAIRASTRGESVQIEFVKEGGKLSREFEIELKTVFGARWQENEFYKLFNEFKPGPLWKDHLLEELLHAYFPHNRFTVQIE